MAITAKTEFEGRDLVPEGSYFGLCIGVYDIGTQVSKQGYDPSHKVVIEFELHRKKGVQTKKDGSPLTIAGFYPLAFGYNPKTKKASKLREAVEGILGKTFTDAEAKAGYDITKLVGTACRLSVAHEKDADGKPTYDYIKSYQPVDEDDPRLESESNQVVYELDTDRDIPDEVPKWIAKQIRKSVEWVKVHGEPTEDGKGSSNGKKPAAKPTATVGATAGREPGSDDDDDDMPF